MRILTGFLLSLLLVVNGLAGAHAPGATATAGAVVAAAGPAQDDHCADRAAPVPTGASDLHGRDCCQDACQCACAPQAQALAALPPPWTAAGGPGADAGTHWPSRRPAPLLRPPIA